MELEPGDALLSINGQPVEDVFDYRYLMNDEFVTLLIRKKNGEEWELEIKKEYDEEIGITFENEFMDQYRSCSNNCNFCFIDQMTPGIDNVNVALAEFECYQYSDNTNDILEALKFFTDETYSE